MAQDAVWVGIHQREREENKRAGGCKDTYYVQSHTLNKPQSCVSFLVSMILEPAFLSTLLLFAYVLYSWRKDKSEVNYIVI